MKGAAAQGQAVNRIEESPTMSVTVRFVVAFFLLLFVGGFGLASALTGFQIVDAINAKSPNGDRTFDLGWNPIRKESVYREYRRLYPDGHLLAIQDGIGFAMLTCLWLAAWLLRFPYVPLLAFGVVGVVVLLWASHFRRKGD